MSGVASVGGGFSFGTLWQEATRAVGYIVDGLVQGTLIASNERTGRDVSILNGRQQNAKSAYESTLPTILIVVIILALLGFAIFKKVKK